MLCEIWANRREHLITDPLACALQLGKRLIHHEDVVEDHTVRYQMVVLMVSSVWRPNATCRYNWLLLIPALIANTA
jgi:hypothetical protein